MTGPYFMFTSYQFHKVICMFVTYLAIYVADHYLVIFLFVASEVPVYANHPAFIL